MTDYKDIRNVTDSVESSLVNPDDFTITVYGYKSREFRLKLSNEALKTVFGEIDVALGSDSFQDNVNKLTEIKQSVLSMLEGSGDVCTQADDDNINEETIQQATENIDKFMLLLNEINKNFINK